MLKQNAGCFASGVMVVFGITFILVFITVVMTATVVTFILPEAYASTARIKLNLSPMTIPATNRPPNEAGFPRVDTIMFLTELGVIQSELILDPVIDQLDLNEAWRKKYNSDVKFKTSDSRAALRHMIEVRPVKNTSLIDVKVYSDDKLEAARIANAIAEEYQLYLAKKAVEMSSLPSVTPLKAEIIEHSEPSNRPVRPNKPLNIMLGIMCGTIFGGMAGAIVAALVDKVKRSRQAMPPALPHP